MQDNNIDKERLRTLKNITIIISIIVIILIYAIATNLYISLSIRLVIIGILLFIPFILSIITLREISSLKKKNGGIKVEKTGGIKAFCIVLIVLFCYSIIICINITMYEHINDSNTANSGQQLLQENDSNTASQDVWQVLPMTDEFGDDINGEYMLRGIFKDNNYNNIVIDVTYTDNLGLVFGFAVVNRLAGQTPFYPYRFSNSALGEFAPSYIVKFKTKTGENVDEYYLVDLTGKSNYVCLMDYFSYAVGQMDSISKGVTNGKDDAMGDLYNEMDELTGGLVSKEKEFYDVNGMLSLLYNSQEDISCIIEDSVNTYNFSISPGNFKAAFDSIWDYNEN